MSDLNERISHLIEGLGMKKTAFAERLNVSQAFVSQLCSGVKQPSERTLMDICREFSVNEEWLRYGSGEMFRQPSDEIGYYVSDLLDYDGEGNPFFDVIIEMMKKYHDLDEKSKEIVRNFFGEVSKGIKKEDD